MFEITLILEGRYLVYISFSDYKDLSVELREKRRVESKKYFEYFMFVWKISFSQSTRINPSTDLYRIVKYFLVTTCKTLIFFFFHNKLYLAQLILSLSLFTAIYFTLWVSTLHQILDRTSNYQQLRQLTHVIVNSINIYL